MNDFPESWAELEKSPPKVARIGGVELRKGSRVRLRPRPGGDILDLALDGQVAIVEAIDQDDQGEFHLSVTLENDPGRHLGEERYLGHRFFFSTREVEPLGPVEAQHAAAASVLVAGIGNIFLGDDGFGVEVAMQMLRRPRRPGLDVVDFGIRGLDLVYALQRDYGAVVLVDIVQRGGPPGTLYLIEPHLEPDAGPVIMDTHGMDPVRVLRLARMMGRVPPRAWVVGCEPERVLDPEDQDEMCMELSAPIRAAIGPAIELIESILVEEAARAEPEPAIEGPEPGG